MLNRVSELDNEEVYNDADLELLQKKCRLYDGIIDYINAHHYRAYKKLLPCIGSEKVPFKRKAYEYYSKCWD